MSTLNSKKNIYLIDAGNTSIKIGQFQDDELVQVVKVRFEDFKHEVSRLSSSDLIVLSSVLSAEQTEELADSIGNCILLNSSTQRIMPNQYNSIETLGTDRLCNAVYAYVNTLTANAVVVDIGTCIKFDVVNKELGYLGGSISPGINLRYRALNHNTGNLPLLSNKEDANLVGDNTVTSIQSGIMNGMKAEIIGVMNEYRREYPNLTFFMTGGDAQYFDIDSKNDIFADENLTLIGLYEIYKRHA